MAVLGPRPRYDYARHRERRQRAGIRPWRCVLTRRRSRSRDRVHLAHGTPRCGKRSGRLPDAKPANLRHGWPPACEFRRADVYRRVAVLWSLLFVAMAAGATSAVADGSPGCSAFDGPKCSIQLSTGITMRYVEVGPRDGPTLFLLHGYTDTSRSWELVVPVLHKLLPGWASIAPALCASGQSSLPKAAGCSSV